MKVSKCCLVKMIKHSITKIKICSKCWYASTSIEIKKWIKKIRQNTNSLNL
jgi:hypothetical protein